MNCFDFITAVFAVLCIILGFIVGPSAWTNGIGWALMLFCYFLWRRAEEAKNEDTNFILNTTNS